MANSINLRFPVDRMSCAGCAARAGRSLAEVPGVRSANVNFATHEASVEMTAETQAGALAKALAQTGKPARVETLRFNVAGMSCGSCAARLEQALAGVPGVLAARVNLATHSAAVDVLAGPERANALAAAAQRAGYPITPQGEPATDAAATAEHEGLDLRRRFLLAAALTVPVVVLEMGGHLVPAFHHWLRATIGPGPLGILLFVLTTAVLAGPGRAFYSSGLAALARRAPDMNSLVAIGTVAAWGYSTVATFAPGLLPLDARAVYFEPAAVIVTLVLGGRWLEARARRRTGAALRRLLDLQPDTAEVENGAGTETRPIRDLTPGDRVRVAAGARIPADGEVINGRSFVDESMLTGEPEPIEKTQGATVTGGTVNGQGALVIRVTAGAGDGRLSRIAAMVAEAQGAKLPVQSLVNRVTLWFVPVVIGIAVLTVAGWLLFAQEPALTQALVAGVSVLIVSCPCAMGLATPVSIMAGTGRAAELGILFRRGDGLQKLTEVKTIAFDKTGTLTVGRPTMMRFIAAPGAPETALAMAAAVAKRSTHPAALALAASQADGSEADEIAETPGRGMTGRVAGRPVALGAGRWLAETGVDLTPLEEAARAAASDGNSTVWVAIDGRLAGFAAIADPVKPGAAAAVAALQRAGVSVAMVTGDAQAPAQRIAERLGIRQVEAEVPPEEKAAAVDRLRATGPVAFVGDGINDAPALALADVGVAIGTGTDVAIETADVVLMGGDPGGVVTARSLSAATLANIKQNLGWAFGYNVALIPVAAGVLAPFGGPMLSPALAAAAMALSSVLVVGNALRLRRFAHGSAAADAPATARDERPEPGGAPQAAE